METKEVNPVEERFSRIVRNLVVSEIVRAANKETGLTQKKLIALAVDVFNGRYSFNYRPYLVGPGIGRSLDLEPLVEVVVDSNDPNLENILDKFRGVLPVEVLN